MCGRRFGVGFNAIVFFFVFIVVVVRVRDRLAAIGTFVIIRVVWVVAILACIIWITFFAAAANLPAR